MGKWRFVASCLLFVVTACASPAEMKRADDFFMKKDFIEAARIYEDIVSNTESSSSKAGIQDKLNETKRQIARQYVTQVDEEYNHLEKVTLPDLRRLIGILDTVLRWDDEKKTISNRKAALAGEEERLTRKAQLLLAAASNDAKNFLFTKAVEKAEKAYSLDTESSLYLNKVNTFKTQQQLSEHIESLLENGDLESALQEYGALVSAYSEPPAFKDSPFKENAISLIEQHAHVMTGKGKWLDTLEYLKKWDIDELDEAIQKISKGGATYYAAVAKQSLEEGNPYKAYLYALRASELNSQCLDVFTIRKKSRDLVDKSIHSYIAVTSFDSPSNDPDAGRQFSDSLNSYLYQMLPYGVNLLERDKIDYLMKENRHKTSKLGDMLGADLVVTGTVSLFKVDSSVDKRSATVKITVGEETVENPEFTQMIRLYGPDMALWPEVPPKTLKKGNVQLVKYTKGTGRKKGFAKVSVRIFDTSKGTITFVKDYDASISKVSEFQDEVADAGIKYIPMNLPSDTEVKEEMRKGIVERIAKVVQASFENRQARFLNQVNFFLDRREYESALKPLAQGHLYCLQDNIDKKSFEFTEMTRIFNEMIR